MIFQGTLYSHSNDAVVHTGWSREDDSAQVFWSLRYVFQGRRVGKVHPSSGMCCYKVGIKLLNTCVSPEFNSWFRNAHL